MSSLLFIKDFYSSQKCTNKCIKKGCSKRNKYEDTAGSKMEDTKIILKSATLKYRLYVSPYHLPVLYPIKNILHEITFNIRVFGFLHKYWRLSRFKIYKYSYVHFQILFYHHCKICPN